MQEKLEEEIKSFQTLWKYGFRTGYDLKRNQKGIEEFLRYNFNAPNTVLLEIGCGGGQWSKFILNNLPQLSKIYCIDVLSAQHNLFWEYLHSPYLTGIRNEWRDSFQLNSEKIDYTQVFDFSLSHIPDNSLDYVFSYDVFCHISATGQNEYLKNLIKKCKPGCKLLIMYADATKFFSSEPEGIKIQQDEQKFYGPVDELIKILEKDADGNPIPVGRWYWIGITKFIEMCENHGYMVILEDLNIDKTNPITFFIKRAF